MKIYVATILLLMFSASSSFSDTLGITLSGLKQVSVGINCSGFNNGNATETQAFKTQIELRLREAGISITPGETGFVVSISALKIPDGSGYAVLVDANLLEPGNFKRINNNPVKASTWNESIMGLAETSSLDERTTTFIDLLVDKFDNDYLKDNPPTSPLPKPACLRPTHDGGLHKSPITSKAI